MTLSGEVTVEALRCGWIWVYAEGRGNIICCWIRYGVCKRMLPRSMDGLRKWKNGVATYSGKVLYTLCPKVGGWLRS